MEDFASAPPPQPQPRPSFGVRFASPGDRYTIETLIGEMIPDCDVPARWRWLYETNPGGRAVDPAAARRCLSRGAERRPVARPGRRCRPARARQARRRRAAAARNGRARADVAVRHADRLGLAGRAARAPSGSRSRLGVLY